MLTVWHPSIRKAGNTLSQPLAVGAGGAVSVVRLRP
jgi:hypothetical protein